MENISVITCEKSVAPHISLDSGDVFLYNVTVELSRDTNNQLSSKSRGIEIRSNDIKLSGGLTMSCPRNFKVDDVKIINEQISPKDAFRWYANNKVTETKYSFLTVDCKACPYGTYSLQNGGLRLSELSTKVPPDTNFTFQEVKCVPCPTGIIS